MLSRVGTELSILNELWANVQALLYFLVSHEIDLSDFNAVIAAGSFQGGQPTVERGEVDAALRSAAHVFSGETEMAVAAACTRAARFIFDATRSPATPLDVLDGLLAQKVRAPMSDAIGRYVEARRNAAGKTHAEAVAALKR